MLFYRFLIKSRTIGPEHADNKVKASSFSSNVFLTMGANVALMAIGLITGSIIARSLGPTGRGELAAIQSWPALLITLGAIGIPQAVTYLTGRSVSTAGRTLGTGLAMLIALSMPLMALGYVLLPLLLQAQSGTTIATARVYLIFIPLQFVMGLPLFALQGRSEIRVWNVLRFFPPIGWLLVVLVAALTGHSTPFFLIAGNLVVTALAIIPIWLALTRWISGPYKPERARIRPLMRFGLPAALTNIPLVLNLRVDQLLMAAWLAPEPLGYYAIAVAWSSGASTLLAAIGNVTFPRIAATNTIGEQSQVLARIVRTSVLLGIGLVGLFAVATPVALPILFGVRFSPAIPAALVLVGAAGIAGINQVLEDGFRGAGHPEQALIAEGTGLVATIILLMLFLRQYQLMGAAIISLVSYSLVLVMLLVSAKRILHLQPTELLIPRQLEVITTWRILLALARNLSTHD